MDNNSQEFHPKPQYKRKNKKSLNTSQNSKGSGKNSKDGSQERGHLAREIKQNFMTLLDNIDFEKKGS